jgi:hypothetical protein
MSKSKRPFVPPINRDVDHREGAVQRRRKIETVWVSDFDTSEVIIAHGNIGIVIREWCWETAE